MAINIDINGTDAEISRRLDRLLKKQIPRWEPRKKEIRRFLRNREEIRLKAQDSFRQTMSAAGVCSFGKNPRSILAWSHYALDHRGICLQFEVARDVGTFAQALPVNYSGEYPVSNWINESEDIIPKLLRKFKLWEYEAELRIVHPEEARQFIYFRPFALSSIIIGCSATAENVEQLRTILIERKSAAWPLPKVYRVFRHPNEFRLCIKKDDLKI